MDKTKIFFLYGAPASGKTTLGAKLAEKLVATFIDLDAQIVATEERTIAEIFSRDGEKVFREIEKRELKNVVATAIASKKTTVVSLGGGTLLDKENRELAEANGSVICLETPDEEELAKRIGAGAMVRPLGDKSRERKEHYESFSSRLATSFDLGGSLILVGENFASKFIASWPVVADENVARFYRDKIANELAIVPSGEEHKTLATIQNLWSSFANAGLSRQSVVAAFGGGVVGDMTGFASATWMRGIDWVNIPTTLLSMVDASSGGKTGFDLPEGKNLIGAFHHPKLVLIDIVFLKTLPRDILIAGKAEMIKHEAIGGLIASKDLVAIPTAKEVAKSLAVKVAIVKEDPFEKFGKRVLLNCGHTIAHAIEKCSNYKISHGDAVAMGCVAEARIASKRQLATEEWVKEFSSRFASAGLPTEIPEDLSREEMREVMCCDKKKENNSVVSFALPCGWGDVRIVKIDLANRDEFVI